MRVVSFEHRGRVSYGVVLEDGAIADAGATAVDLVGYDQHAGGLDQVATLLSELAEQIDQQRLLAAAQTASLLWAQRLGYLLDLVGAHEKTGLLKAYVQENARDATPLLPAAPYEHARRSADWKVFINADVEPEI